MIQSDKKRTKTKRRKTKKNDINRFDVFLSVVYTLLNFYAYFENDRHGYGEETYYRGKFGNAINITKEIECSRTAVFRNFKCSTKLHYFSNGKESHRYYDGCNALGHYLQEKNSLDSQERQCYKICKAFRTYVHSNLIHNTRRVVCDSNKEEIVDHSFHCASQDPACYPSFNDTLVIPEDVENNLSFYCQVESHHVHINRALYQNLFIIDSKETYDIAVLKDKIYFYWENWADDVFHNWLDCCSLWVLFRQILSQKVILGFVNFKFYF